MCFAHHTSLLHTHSHGAHACRANGLIAENALQGYLAQKKQPPPPQDHHRTPGIVLLQGPGRGGVLMSEVPLYVRPDEHVREGAAVRQRSRNYRNVTRGKGQPSFSDGCAPTESVFAVWIFRHLRKATFSCALHVRTAELRQLVGPALLQFLDGRVGVKV